MRANSRYFSIFGCPKIQRIVLLHLDIFGNTALSLYDYNNYDYVISNPDFKAATATLRLAQELVTDTGFILVLLPSDWLLGAKKRLQRFQSLGLRIIKKYELGRNAYLQDSKKTRMFTDALFVLQKGIFQSEFPTEHWTPPVPKLEPMPIVPPLEPLIPAPALEEIHRMEAEEKYGLL